MPKEKGYIHNTEVAMIIDFDNGAKLTAEYKEFLERIIENDAIWILFDEGRISVIEIDEYECATLWSTRELAEKSKEGEWSDFEVQSLSVAEFITLCIPDLLAMGVDVLLDFRDGEGIHRELPTLEEDIYDAAETLDSDLVEKCEEFYNFLEANDVYEGFIEDIIEAGRLWILIDEEDNVILADVEEDEVLPVWTSESEAFSMCTDEWEGCEPQDILIDDFLEDWIPMLEEDGTNIMFDINEEGGMGTAAAIVAEDLRNTMKMLSPNFDNVIQFPGNKLKS